MLKRRKKDATGDHSLIVQNDPKAIGSEAFRTLRMNLQFTSPDQELKTLLFTSVGPGDGKSTVSANLAVVSAQFGQRVVLVGCDLRIPVVHQIFSVSNSPGLTGYLTGQGTLDDAILPSKIVNGLDVIPSGPIPPNSAELLQSSVMTEAIEELKERYDLVIFDGAPAIAVTDAAIMASKVDGTVLVVRAHEVPKEMALQAKDLLEQANGRLLGVVMNGVRPQNKKSYQYYYSYDQADQA